MKKMIVMALAVTFVMSASAATVRWGNGMIYAQGTTAGVNTVNGTAWLIEATGVITVDNSGTLLVDGSAASVPGSNVQALIGNYDFSNGAGDVTFGNDYVLVIYDSDEGVYGISDAVTATSNPAIPAEANDMNLYNTAADANGYGMNTMVLSIETVPEPTSMALLALGIVALGFRRKK